jgi:hypothetical protein
MRHSESRCGATRIQDAVHCGSRAVQSATPARTVGMAEGNSPSRLAGSDRSVVGMRARAAILPLRRWPWPRPRSPPLSGCPSSRSSPAGRSSTSKPIRVAAHQVAPLKPTLSARHTRGAIPLQTRMTRNGKFDRGAQGRAALLVQPSKHRDPPKQGEPGRTCSRRVRPAEPCGRFS